MSEDAKKEFPIHKEIIELKKGVAALGDNIYKLKERLTPIMIEIENEKIEEVKKDVGSPIRIRKGLEYITSNTEELVKVTNHILKSLEI